MAEPEQLKRGKRFQKIVQQDFEQNSKNGKVIPEAFVSFKELKEIKQKSGRMDILIKELGDFVTIVEIKATNWDNIKPENIKRNLYRHQKQLFNYIDKFLEIDKLDVCLGIVYPKPPKKEGLKEFIEKYLEDNYGVPAYWFNELKPEGLER
jgi:hypothetical protein